MPHFVDTLTITAMLTITKRGRESAEPSMSGRPNFYISIGHAGMVCTG